jgi:hypothetical protein
VNERESCTEAMEAERWLLAVWFCHELRIDHTYIGMHRVNPCRWWLVQERHEMPKTTRCTSLKAWSVVVTLWTSEPACGQPSRAGAHILAWPLRQLWFVRRQLAASSLQYCLAAAQEYTRSGSIVHLVWPCILYFDLVYLKINKNMQWET